MITDPNDIRIQARALLLKARIFRVFALAFAVFGLLLFGVIYSRHAGGDAFAALKDVRIVTIILVPFLPAIVLSFIANRAEKKFFALLRPPEEEEK